MEHKEVTARATGAVEHGSNLILLEQMAIELYNRRIKLIEFAKEQIIPFRKASVPVAGHNMTPL